MTWVSVLVKWEWKSHDSRGFTTLVPMRYLSREEEVDRSLWETLENLMLVATLRDNLPSKSTVSRLSAYGYVNEWVMLPPSLIGHQKYHWIRAFRLWISLGPRLPGACHAVEWLVHKWVTLHPPWLGPELGLNPHISANTCGYPTVVSYNFNSLCCLWQAKLALQNSLNGPENIMKSTYFDDGFHDLGLHQVTIEWLSKNLQVSKCYRLLDWPHKYHWVRMLQLSIRDSEVRHMIAWRLRRQPRNYGRIS